MPFATLAILQFSGGSAALAPLLMYGGIFAIFYFLLIRPQQQQRKKHEMAVLELKKGDRVVTAGGLIGEVQHIRTTGANGAATADDEITVKSGESRLVVERGRIAKISSGSSTSSADKVA
ncbi:MAG TPA: preprotein translocase subunit YajC [Gemmatimonadaceae bacterium]|nr:preprotein translocase subunit YajC [Gemmatimonadaceae bacterium]